MEPGPRSRHQGDTGGLSSQAAGAQNRSLHGGPAPRRGRRRKEAEPGDKVENPRGAKSRRPSKREAARAKYVAPRRQDCRGAERATASQGSRRGRPHGRQGRILIDDCSWCRMASGGRRFAYYLNSRWSPAAGICSRKAPMSLSNAPRDRHKPRRQLALSYAAGQRGSGIASAVRYLVVNGNFYIDFCRLEGGSC